MRKSTSDEELRSLRRQNAALIELQEVTSQSLVFLDSGLRVLSANRCFYEYFETTPRLSLGRRLRELAGGRWGGKDLVGRLKDALTNGTPFHNFEMEFHSPNLGQRLLRLRGVRVANEERGAHTLFVTITDITDLRRAETHKAVEERERTQREFIANVSHELRTPVTAIKGYAQTLLQGGLEDTKHRASFVHTIERHADRLTRLIADLLRIATLMERPAPQIRRIRLRDAVERCLADAAAAAKAGRVSVRARVPSAMRVSADRDQLSDVLAKLIVNAVKFNRPGGSVTVSARTAGHDTVITVDDTGVGVPEKDFPRLFERFYRGRNARTRQGAGLGLSIAQQIVSAHGGRIWAENRKGRGASFHFTLPLA